MTPHPWTGRVVSAWFVMSPAGPSGPWYLQSTARELGARHRWKVERREVRLYADGTYCTLLPPSRGVS